jgi:carbamoyltransferase
VSIILGLNSYFHDSSAALLVDGNLIAFAEEERFNRKKHTYEYPYDSIKWCLEYAGLKLKDVDSVAYYVDMNRYLSFSAGMFVKNLPYSINYFMGGATTTPLINRVFSIQTLKSTIRKRNGNGSEKFVLYKVPHHMTHVGTAFYPSGFDKAAIITMDVAGDGIAHVIAVGEGKKTKIVNLEKTPNALGVFYGSLTKYLGFKFNDEYKVMGMSAYGEPEYYDWMMDQLVSFDDSTGKFKLNEDYFCIRKYGLRKMYTDLLVKKLGKSRANDEALESKHFNIAASMQRCCEEIGVSIARYARRVTGLDNLCLSGGVVQNCLMNMRIMEEGIFSKVFAQPLCSDVGGSLGAALHVAHAVNDEPRNFTQANLYYGPEYSNEEIKASLEAHGLNYFESNDIANIVAEDISNGKIIGCFDGRMEAGPRALGNRSLLADPRRADMKDILNSRVKHREYFRPFAPSVLREYAHEYFDIPKSSMSEEYMIVTYRVKPNMASLIPAVSHADNTSRIQVVDREQNLRYWQILEAFRLRTGCPMVINTSYNDNEPIVSSPDDAINCFKRTLIDTLAIGPYIVRREDNNIS